MVKYKKFVCGSFEVFFGIAQAGDKIRLSVPDGYERSKAGNVVLVVKGTAEFREYPDGFMPVTMRQGMANDDIPDYPAGLYMLEAQEEYRFFCVSPVAKGAPFDRTTVKFPSGGDLMLSIGEVAVFNQGGFTRKGEHQSAPAIAFSKDGPLNIYADNGSKCVVFKAV